MPPWMVIIESDEPSSRDVYEVTPPPEPGSERAVLAELVAVLHPDAVETSYADGTATFTDGSRTIRAAFERDGRAPEPPGPSPEQGRLFGA